MVKHVVTALAAACVLGWTVTALAQDTTAPAVPTDACAGAEHHQFDFWIGEWNAEQTADQRPAGRSTIASEDQDCVVTEHWRSLSAPFTGHSLNLYDRADGKWHQVWMDSTGDVTRFSGGVNAAGQIVLVAEDDVSPGAPAPVFNRMTFTPNPDGSVRQHGEQSADRGQTWTTAYDFTYRRAPQEQPASPE